MLASILVLTVVISASIHIRGEYYGPPWSVYVFKPLTMVFIVTIAVVGQASSPLYRNIVLGGLLFSIAGDVFLMLPSDRFVAGLASFLIAHLFYIGAFSWEIIGMSWWPLIPLIVCGLVFFLVLAPSLGKLRAPVLLYGVVILSMAWFAWERWIGSVQGEIESGGSFQAFLGAILFVISDMILALNRFKGDFRAARVLNLAAYFAAQLLIAGSTGLLVQGS